MQANTCTTSTPLLSVNVGYNENITAFSHRDSEKKLVLVQETPSSSIPLYYYKKEAETGISKIKDPLWHRICIDLLEILGPVVFKDFWKIKLMRVSAQGRTALLICPNETLAQTIEKYYFVIIDVLKKFYPFLFSLETEICSNENCHIHKI